MHWKSGAAAAAATTTIIITTAATPGPPSSIIVVAGGVSVVMNSISICTASHSSIAAATTIADTTRMTIRYGGDARGTAVACTASSS